MPQEILFRVGYEFRYVEAETEEFPLSCQNERANGGVCFHLLEATLKIPDNLLIEGIHFAS